MVPIWLAMAPALIFAAVGATVDRLGGLGLAGGWGQWPRWIACGLTIAFATYIHPVALLLLTALVVLARTSAGASVTASASRPSSALAPYVAVMAFALAAVAVLRPAMPMYWDDFVWLGKARIESGGLGHLRAAALDPDADVIPHGYPLLWPLAASSRGPRSRRSSRFSCSSTRQPRRSRARSRRPPGSTGDRTGRLAARLPCSW